MNFLTPMSSVLILRIIGVKELRRIPNYVCGLEKTLSLCIFVLTNRPLHDVNIL